MVRILHVVATGDRRGGEVFALDLVRALKASGVSQRVAVLRGSGPVAVPYEAPVVRLERDGWVAPGLRMAPRTLSGLRALLRKGRPDIVQAHGGQALKYSIAAAAGQDTQVVYRRIGTAPRWMARGLRRMVHGGLMRRAACLVAVAEAVAHEATDVFGVPPERVVTIPNGVDPERTESKNDREEIRRALGVPPRARVVLSLGALTWEKDPLVHIQVAERLIRRLGDVVHLLVGGGPMREVVEETIRRRRLGESVLLLGSRSDVPDLLAASDLLLFASRTDGMEGMPAGIIEAGMAGLPTAAYAVAGVPEIVADGATGLLAPPGDLDALEACALDLLTDGDACRSMGKAARERCSSLFDIRVIAPQYLKVYEELRPHARSRA